MRSIAAYVAIIGLAACSVFAPVSTHDATDRDDACTLAGGELVQAPSDTMGTELTCFAAPFKE